MQQGALVAEGRGSLGPRRWRDSLTCVQVQNVEEMARVLQIVSVLAGDDVATKTAASQVFACVALMTSET